MLNNYERNKNKWKTPKLGAPQPVTGLVTLLPIWRAPGTQTNPETLQNLEQILRLSILIHYKMIGGNLNAIPGI
jgi:hypothetical protein